jgi:hypothetical protein
MDRLRQRRRQRVLPRAREKRHAARPPVARAWPGGHGDAAQVHQVDEVRVGPEAAVRADRVGLEVGQAVEGGDRRHAEEIGSRHQRLGPPAQVGEPVDAAEGVGRRQAVRRADDPRRHGVQRAGIAAHQILDHRHALGHPGAFVEHPRHVVEGGEVDLARCRAPRAGARGRLEARRLRRRRRRTRGWRRRARRR